jgi:hypothetical protein
MCKRSGEVEDLENAPEQLQLCSVGIEYKPSPSNANKATD